MPNHLVRYGDFEIDTLIRKVHHQGMQVRIGERAAALFGILAEKPGELFSKDQLLQAVWPNVTVAESNLRVHIAELRKVLDVLPGASSALSNIIGQGYSLAAAPEAAPSRVAPAIQSPSSKKLLGRDDAMRTPGRYGSRPPPRHYSGARRDRENHARHALQPHLGNVDECEKLLCRPLPFTSFRPCGAGRRDRDGFARRHKQSHRKYNRRPARHPNLVDTGQLRTCRRRGRNLCRHRPRTGRRRPHSRHEAGNLFGQRAKPGIAFPHSISTAARRCLSTGCV